MFIATNDKISIIPDDSMEKIETFVREHLKTEVVRMNVGESNLTGLYIAMNKNGIILPNIATESEIADFKKLGLNVYHSMEPQNAHGNNLSVNDKGGIINPNIPSAERLRMEDVLGIELVPMKVANYVTVGSSVLCANKGFLSHFASSADELKEIGDALKVRGEKGSINMGVGFVAFGAICNKHGYIVGEQTSAHEMGRIESALGFID